LTQYVSCQLCGVQRKRLGAHLKSAHQLSVGSYKELFPSNLVEVLGSRRRSKACREKQAAAARKRWESKAERKAQSDRLKASAPWAGKNLSSEHKRRIGEGGRGVKHRITVENRKRLGDQGRRALEEIRTRPGYAGRLAKAQKERALRPEAMGFQNPETWQKAYDAKVRNGTLVPEGAGRGITGFRRGIPHYCRSTVEANFARILVHEGVLYEYEPKVFLLPDGQRWTPDFFLHDPCQGIPAGWVEIKGWRKKDGSLPGGASEKISAFEAMTGEGVFVLVQNSPEWRVLKEKYAQLIPWERPRFNLRTHPDTF
jgi:hypothetical protein